MTQVLRQPAGGGGKRPEEIIADRMLFDLPDGDAGVAKSRQIMEFTCDSGQSAVFTPGMTTYFTLPSNGGVLDTSLTFISCRVQLSGFTGWPILPRGGQSLIENFEITSFGGQFIEQINDYNVIAAAIDSYTLSHRWRYYNGEMEGFPPVPDPSGFHPAVASCANNIFPKTDGTYSLKVAAAAGVGGIAVALEPAGALGLRSRMLRYVQSWTAAPASGASTENSGRTLLIPLRHSGLFGNTQVVPLNSFGQLRIAIKWAAANKAFQVVGLQASYPLAGPIGDAHLTGVEDAATLTSESSVVGHWRKQFGTAAAASGFTSTAVIGTYTVTACKIVSAVVQVSAAVQDTMNRAVEGNGLPIHFPTYARFRTQVPANSAGAFSFVVQKNVSSASSLLAWWVTDPANTTATDDAKIQDDTQVRGGTTYSALADKFDMWQGGIRGWQFRIGTEVMPRFQVREQRTGYAISMEAVPKPPMADLTPCVPFHRYSDEGEKYMPVSASSFASMVVGSGSSGNGLRAYFVPGLHIDDENYPNRFLIGVCLQSTPGFELAGQSTVSGSQAQLEIQLANAASLGTQYGGLIAQNERINLNKDLFLCMVYRRVALVTGKQNVSVKE